MNTPKIVKYRRLETIYSYLFQIQVNLILLLISVVIEMIFVVVASVYQIHVIACNSGVAYTLRMPWIKKIVFQLENSSHHASEKEPFLKQASNATTAKLIFQPVKDTSVNKDALMTRLGAAVLILDPVLGHLMMLRTLSGHLTIINLTVLDKLYLLETKLQVLRTLIALCLCYLCDMITPIRIMRQV